MKKLFTCSALLIAGSLGLAGCGGGGGGSDSSSSSTSFTGAWVGHFDTGPGPSPLEVDISGTSITKVSTDATLTGTISQMHGNVYKIALYSGGYEADTGGFLKDDSGNHAGFLMDSGDFGVLQKDGPATATWTQGDSEGTWKGYTLQVDPTGTTITSYTASTVTIDATGGLTGNGPYGDIIGQVGLYDPSAGTFTGEWGLPNSSSYIGNLKVWISADKTFAAAYACSSLYAPTWYSLDSCTYYAWTKQ